MKLDEIDARIGIPPRTPFVALFRYSDSWLAWIAVRDMQQPYSKWQGSYLRLYDNGSVERVTIYDDGHEDIMVVR